MYSRKFDCNFIPHLFTTKEKFEKFNDANFSLSLNQIYVSFLSFFFFTCVTFRYVCTFFHLIGFSFFLHDYSPSCFFCVRVSFMIFVSLKKNKGMFQIDGSRLFFKSYWNKRFFIVMIFITIKFRWLRKGKWLCVGVSVSELFFYIKKNFKNNLRFFTAKYVCSRHTHTHHTQC